MDCLRRVSHVKFYIASEVWGHIKRDKQAAEMTKLYAESLPFIAAMTEAISISRTQRVSLDQREGLLISRLAPTLFGKKPEIPRRGSTVPDNLAKSGDYNFRWDSLPQYDWDSMS